MQKIKYLLSVLKLFYRYIRAFSTGWTPYDYRQAGRLLKEQYLGTAVELFHDGKFSRLDLLKLDSCLPMSDEGIAALKNPEKAPLLPDPYRKHSGTGIADLPLPPYPIEPPAPGVGPNYSNVPRRSKGLSKAAFQQLAGGYVSRSGGVNELERVSFELENAKKILAVTQECYDKVLEQHIPITVAEYYERLDKSDTDPQNSH